MGPSDVKGLIRRALAGVRQALKGKVLRVTGTKRVLLVQGDGVAGEKFIGTEYFQHPGFRSMPLAGMQKIVIPLNGKSAAGVVVAMSNGALFIADLQDGECAVFNENDGVANSLILRNGRIAELTTGTFNIKATIGVNFDTPTVTMSGLLDVAGDIQSAGDVAAGDISLIGHRHSGVEPGTGISGDAQ